MTNPDIGRTADVTSAAQHLKRVDKQARRVLNRGLESYIRSIIAEHYDADGEFNTNDLWHRVDHAKWPHADAIAVSATLPQLVNKRFLVRVGGLKSGLYRRTYVETPAESRQDDGSVLENALSALADVERIVRRHQAIIERLRAAGIRLEE